MKCSFGDGVVIKPDGMNELDPCVYQEIERYANVTISVLKCKQCGHIELCWYKQDDTVELDVE